MPRSQSTSSGVTTRLHRYALSAMIICAVLGNAFFGGKPKTCVLPTASGAVGRVSSGLGFSVLPHTSSHAAARARAGGCPPQPTYKTNLTVLLTLKPRPTVVPVWTP